MDKFAALKAFVTVVEEGGFAAAARETGQSRSAVNRLVIGLEDELGAQLLNRTTRSVATTASGRAYYERARGILDQLAEADGCMTEMQETPAGDMRINAPMTFGTMHLAPAIADFMAKHPGVRIQLDLNDRLIDVVEEGYDMTIRITVPSEDTTLVDHRITKVRTVICASPEYLEREGTPATPRDLATHACLHYGGLQSGHAWPLQGPDGAIAAPVNVVMASNNGEVLADAALRGLGIVYLPTFIVGRELQAGRLASILPEFTVSTLTLCAIYPPSRHLSAKVRLLTDFLVERFGKEPYWDLVT